MFRMTFEALDVIKRESRGNRSGFAFLHAREVDFRGARAT